MSFKGVRACFTGSNEPWQLLSNAGWSELGWKEENIEVPMQWDPRGNCRECRDDPITFSSKILSSKQLVLSKEDLITSNMMRNGILSLLEAQKTDFGGDIFKIKNGC